MSTPQHTGSNSQETQKENRSILKHPIFLVLLELLKLFFLSPIAFLSGLFSGKTAFNSQPEDPEDDLNYLQSKVSESNSLNLKSEHIKMNSLRPILKETQQFVDVSDIPLDNQPNTDVYDFPTISLDQLHSYENSEYIYVGINGWVYDVSHRTDAYGPRGSYGIFSNKDASRALAMSSLSASDVKDSEGREGSLLGLEEQQFKTLNQWESFFQQRYKIIASIPKPYQNEIYENYKFQLQS